jgi:hypothetical protein
MDRGRTTNLQLVIKDSYALHNNDDDLDTRCNVLLTNLGEKLQSKEPEQFHVRVKAASNGDASRRCTLTLFSLVLVNKSAASGMQLMPSRLHFSSIFIVEAETSNSSRSHPRLSSKTPRN